MTRQLAIRFDVDTHRCVREGMPALSELGRELGVPFTFFVNMGRAVFLPGRLMSERREPRPVAAKLPARQKLGVRRWLEAAILNPRVGAGSPDVLRAAAEAGHEIGLHGGRNHARWQREAQEWTASRVGAEIDAVLPLLRDALDGAPVRGFASPGWTTHPALPDLLAQRGFHYLADLHGPQPASGVATEEPVGPLHTVRTQLTGEPGGVAYLEHLRACGLDDDAVVRRAMDDLAGVGPRAALYDHPYHAGVRELETLRRIVQSARDEGYRIVSMAELAGTERAA
ncbi:MAG: polysaccharide deacetylase family protein [Longimicrobiales bacterium]|nr:polysaccharide deacetylase family protein [Longimicrobiales bacterium]